MHHLCGAMQYRQAPLPKGVYPLLKKRLLPNLAWGGSSRSAPSCQISSLWLKKYGSTAPKIANIGIFCINLPKGGIPLKQFLQNLAWRGSPRSAPSCHAKFHRCGFKNVGYSPQNRENGNFWYKFAPKGKFRGPQKKLNIGAHCTTTNLL